MDQADIDQAIQSSRLTLVNNYATAAFVTVLLYDIAITLGDEIEFVWRQRGLSVGKLLFLLNRYIPPIDLVILLQTYINSGVNQGLCIPWFQVDNWLSVFSLAIVDIILLLRTWALWNRSPRILAFLLTVFVVCTLATVGAVVYFSLTVFAVPTFPKVIRPCEDGVTNPNVLETVWASTILFDSTILIFTIIKIIPHFKAHTITTLLKKIYQDGFLYFAVLFTISVSNLFVFALAPPQLKLMIVTLQRAMFSLLCSRIVLNLRGVLTRRLLITDSQIEDEASELSAFQAAPRAAISNIQTRDSAILVGSSHRTSKRIVSSVPSKRQSRKQLDSFGYVNEGDDDGSEYDDQDTPQDESPETPWSQPWNPFRADSASGNIEKSLEEGLKEDGAKEASVVVHEHPRISGEDGVDDDDTVGGGGLAL